MPQGTQQDLLSAVACGYTHILVYLCFLVYLNACKIHLNRLSPGTSKSFPVMFTCSFILANTPLPFCVEASVEGRVKGRRARALQLSSPAACSRLSKERIAAAGSPLTPHLAVFPQSKEVQLAGSNFSPEFIFYSGVKF